MTQDITSLIEKLEGAEVGSRGLDLDVAQAFSLKLWGRRHPSTGSHQWMTEIGGRSVPVPRFTTSLDAALALAERVLPGWYVGVQANRRHEMPDDWTAYLAPPEIKDGPEREASSHTPALALCAALLRAQSEAR